VAFVPWKELLDLYWKGESGGISAGDMHPNLFVFLVKIVVPRKVKDFHFKRSVS